MAQEIGINKEASSDGAIRNILLQDIDSYCLDRDGMVLAHMGFSPNEVATYKDRVRRDISTAEFNGQLLGRLNMTEITPPEHAEARGYMHAALKEALEGKGFSNEDFNAAQDELERKAANQ